MPLTLASTAFQNHGVVPTRHTCDGADVSPALSWSGVPSGTAALVLIVDDPDAPGKTWVHWVLFGIPAGATGLPEGVSKVEAPKEVKGALQGKNDFGRLGYGGPCPPPGPPHRYFFKLYAIGKPLALRAGASKRDVERTMEGHVLASAELVASYARQRS